MCSSFTRWQSFLGVEASVIWLTHGGHTWNFQAAGTSLARSLPFLPAVRCSLWRRGGSYLERKADSVGKRRCYLLRCYCSALWTYRGKIQHLLCWGNPFYAERYLRTEEKYISEQHLEVQVIYGVITLPELKSPSTLLRENLHTHQNFWEISKF